MAENDNVWSFLKNLSYEVVAAVGIFLLLLVFTDSIEINTGVVHIKNNMIEFRDKLKENEDGKDQSFLFEQMDNLS